MQIVEDAMLWELMDGDTEEQQKINSILTCRFIIRHDVPSDECLDYAETLCELEDPTEDDIYERLVWWFGDAADSDEDGVHLSGYAFETVSEEILAILEGED